MSGVPYYLHEKAEESRHSESQAVLIAIMGAVFLVGGIIVTLVTLERPRWFLIFAYDFGSSPYDYLGLAFTLLGVILLIGGISFGLYYGSQRTWYSNTLKERFRNVEETLRAQNKSQSDQQLAPTVEATSQQNISEIKTESAG